MGMTISEAISKLRYELNKNNKMVNAYVVAIETMRKYQKIQEIIKDWEDGRFSDVVGCLRVKAVLDGNDD